MGIPGLLPQLKSITKRVNISSYKGLTAGVDAMCWLHKAIHSSSSTDMLSMAEEQHGEEGKLGVASWRANPNPNFIKYTINRVRTLLKAGLGVILVIDGAPLPSKKGTDTQRREDRKMNYQKGVDLLRQHKKKEATKFFAKSVGITQEMRHLLVLKLREEGIDFIVAPYEADAQLAFLARTMLIDVVITEDSDSLVYSCSRVLFKLDHNGEGDEILHSSLGSNQALSFSKWTQDMFLNMAILTGCDYAPHVKGIGIVKAHKLVRLCRKPEHILKALRKVYKEAVPEHYEQHFIQAFLTFQHQRIYNTESQQVEMLYDPNFTEWTWCTLRRKHGPIQLGETDFLGYETSQKLGSRIAQGIVHPVHCVSWEVIDEFGGEAAYVNATTAAQSEQSQQTQQLLPPVPPPTRNQPKDPSEQTRGQRRQQQVGNSLFSPPLARVNLASVFDASTPPLTSAIAQRQNQQSNGENAQFESIEQQQRPTPQPEIGRPQAQAQAQAQAASPAAPAAITSDQYNSALLGPGFETLARRRRRVGDVVIDHQWADADAFARENNMASDANPNAHLLDGVLQVGRKEVAAALLPRPFKATAATTRATHRQGRGRDRNRVVTADRQQRKRSRTRSRSNHHSFPRINTRMAQEETEPPMLRDPSNRTGVAAVAGPQSLESLASQANAPEQYLRKALDPTGRAKWATQTRSADRPHAQIRDSQFGFFFSPPRREASNHFDPFEYSSPLAFPSF
ncbi:hypothetical protein TrVE_jg13980 [Triparma verrucosa]|uniref:Exonuclease 1 n=1 Tax=Triparma verrucosa TaxID=1606542 RepID=A0A9W7KUC5_9STRA|nr:hypothetical protein TrVE_jg13980 [Triparma verrucosa]